MIRTVALLVALVLITSCTNIRMARTAHAASTVYDYTSTIRQMSTGKYAEANVAVRNVWPATVSSIVLWGLAELLENKGYRKTATGLHWAGAFVHAGAGTYNLSKGN